MSKFYEETMQGLAEAVAIEKGKIPLAEKNDMPAPTFVAAEENNLIDLEQYAKDGRLTEPTDGKIFDYRKMRDRVEQLNRPLTDEEAEEYRLRDPDFTEDDVWN